MAWTNSIAVQNAATNAATALVDAGSTNAAGKLIIYDSDDVALVEFDLSNPAFDSAVNGQATANAISPGTAIASGVADYFKIVNRDEEEVFGGDVGDDMTIDNPNIAENQTVVILSIKYRAIAQSS